MSEQLEEVDVISQEVIAPEQEVEQETQPEQQISKNNNSEKEIQEKNWKLARSKMEEQSREIQLLRQELQSIRESNKPEAHDPDEEYFTESEKKLYSKIKDLERKANEQKAKESDYVIDRLKSKYSDFNDVVCAENLTYLQTNNPALAKALSLLSSDPYEQGLAVYDALKKTDWYEQRQNMEDKAKIEANSKKPMSVQAVKKQGALADANRFANGLTPELKKQLIQEMADSRKRS